MRTITTLAARDLIIVFAIGFLTLFIAPIVGFMLMLTIVAIPLALIGMLVWTLLIVVSAGVTSYLHRSSPYEKSSPSCCYLSCGRYLSAKLCDSTREYRNDPRLAHIWNGRTLYGIRRVPKTITPNSSCDEIKGSIVSGGNFSH